MLKLEVRCKSFWYATTTHTHKQNYYKKLHAALFDLLNFSNTYTCIFYSEPQKKYRFTILPINSKVCPSIHWSRHFPCLCSCVTSINWGTVSLTCNFFHLLHIWHRPSRLHTTLMFSGRFPAAFLVSHSVNKHHKKH